MFMEVRIRKLREDGERYMSSKFTVINSTEEDKSKEKDRTSRIIKLCNLWERQCHNTVLQIIQKNKDIKLIADYPQEDLMKAAFGGIKYVNFFRELKREHERIGTDYVQTLEEAQATFQFIDAIFTICGYLTLRNFVTTFPIDKFTRAISGKKGLFLHNESSEGYGLG